MHGSGSRLLIAIAIAFVFTAIAGGFAFIAQQTAENARADHLRAEQERAIALVDSARASIERRRHLEAKAKLRAALEISDSALARLLWWRLDTAPLLWERSVGTGLFDVAVSPTLDRYAAAGQDGTIRILDTTLAAATRLRGHADQVMRLAFAPDGRLASSSSSGEVRVWDLSAGTSKVVLSGRGRIAGLGFTRHGLVTVSAGGTVRRIDDSLERTGPPAKDAAISEHAIAVAAEGLVLLLDPRTLQEMHAIEVPKVTAVAISQKGTLAAATSRGQIVILENDEPKMHTVHPGMILRIGFDQRGRIISAGQGGTVRLLEPASGDVRVIARHQGAVWGVAAAGDAVLSGGNDRRLALHRLDAPPPVVEGHRESVTALAFTEAGVVSGGHDRRVLAWTDNGEATQELLLEEGAVYGLASRGELLASGSRSGTVRLLERSSGRELASYGDHEGPVYAVAVAADGKTVVSGGSDGTVRSFSIDQKGAVMTGHRGAVYDVAIADDGRIASAGADKTVRLWDANGRPLQVLEGHRDKVWAVAFGPQGGLISAGYDGAIRAWSLPSGEATVIGRHEGRIYSIAIDKSGSHVASAGSDGAFLWTPAEGKKVRLAGHAGEVNEVRFARSAPLLATAGEDGTVRVWDLAGRPQWWASLFDAGQLATPAGWRDARGRVDAEMPWEKPAKRAARGSACRTHACLLQPNQQVELWWDAKSPRWSVEIPGARDVRAVESGCVVLGGKNAALHPISGEPIELLAGAEAIGADADSIMAAGPEKVVRFDLSGRLLEEERYGGGAVAIARAQDRFVLGYADGGIEVLRRAGTFEGTPSGRVVRLEAGPMGMVIAGFADGSFGMWDVETGAELVSARVHGPASLIETIDRNISIASELGAHGASITTFAPDYCMLLRSIWQEVPLVWEGGGVIAAPPPAGHRCAAR